MQYEKKQFFNTKTSRILRYSSWLQRGERIKSHFAIAVYYIDENLNAIKGQHMSCTPIIFPLFLMCIGGYNAELCVILGMIC